MSDEWRKRRKRPWFDVFVEFKRIEKMMDEMMRRSFRRPFKPSKEKNRFFGRPHVYGFILSTGPDGKPRIREFGNLQRSRFGPRVRREREPLVDILEENEEIVVVAELPGVEKENINLHTCMHKNDEITSFVGFSRVRVNMRFVTSAMSRARA